MSKGTNKKKSFVAEHKKVVMILAAAFVCLSVIAPFLLYKGGALLNVGMSRIEFALYVAQIISAVFVAIGVFVALLQYYLVTRSETIKTDADRIEKAIKLAEFYKDEVLEYYAPIRAVYQKVGIYDRLQKEKKKMKELDGEEMNEIFSEAEIAEIKSTLNSKELVREIADLYEQHNLKICGCESHIIDEADGKKRKEISIDPQKVLSDFHTNYVSRLLNNVEYFAMYFTHNVADESVVYQSLYPTYIELCRTLYFDIARCSPNGSPKLYRNLQGLYDIWLVKSQSKKEKIAEHEHSERGSVLDISR